MKTKQKKGLLKHKKLLLQKGIDSPIPIFYEIKKDNQ